MELQQNDPDQNNILGGSDDVSSLESDTPASGEGSGSSPSPAKPPEPRRSASLRRRIFGFITSINIYLLLFILIVVVAAIVVYVIIQLGRKQAQQPISGNEALSSDTLNKLKNQDVSVGDAKQTLNIEANAVFAGKVLIRNGLDVAGPLKVGGSLSLAGLTVAGTSTVDQLQTNGISVSGNATVQGQLTIQKGLNVSGGGAFGGALTAPQLTVTSLQLSGDLQISRHITTAGGTPSLSSGTALGGGGTASIGGTDTAGTVTVNTGNSPPAGCFATITFRQTFGSTPHIVITPVGSSGGAVDYYLNRSNTNFSICSASSPPGGQSFAFDYMVMN